MVIVMKRLRRLQLFLKKQCKYEIRKLMNRRDFLFGFGSAAFLHAGEIDTVLANSSSLSGHKVVIIGGGWGGLSAATTIKRITPNIEVILIERGKKFKSCPISNWVIGHIKSMSDISSSYHKLLSKYGIKIIFSEVNHIDVQNKKVYLPDNQIDFDKLIISPGIELDYSKIEGWNLDSAFMFPSAWKAGEETLLLKNRLNNLRNGGVVCISIPSGPYRCPPGPYERASLIAAFLKKNKPKSKLIILDANQKIISKGKLFKAAWDELYQDIIDYRSDSKVIAVNSKKNAFYTDFEEIFFDVGNLIPPQKAPSFLISSGFVPEGRRWVPVSAYDFRSLVSNDIYVIGDSTDQTTIGKIPKSGYIANSMGKVSSLSIISDYLNLESLSPSMINTCYSLVSPEEGISVSAVYKFDKQTKRIINVNKGSGLSPNRSSAIAQNAWDWAQSIWADMLT